MAFGSRFRWVSALFLCASVALAGCGGEEAPEPAAVSIDRSAEAATVNGQIIYVADVELEARMKGVIEEGETLEPSSVEFDEILDQLIEVKLLSMEAIARGLDEDPEARHRLETARDNILGNVLLDVIASERIDEAEIRKMYETQVELLEQQMENEARCATSSRRARMRSTRSPPRSRRAPTSRCHWPRAAPPMRGPAWMAATSAT
jgi:hypothetical protein